MCLMAVRDDIYIDIIYNDYIHIVLTHWGRMTDICVNKLSLSEPVLEYCYLETWEQTSVTS